MDKFKKGELGVDQVRLIKVDIVCLMKQRLVKFAQGSCELDKAN